MVPLPRLDLLPERRAAEPGRAQLGSDLPQAGIAGNGYGPRLSYLSLHTATPAPNVDVTPQVAEKAGLVDTHINLAAGDRVVFYASGTIWAGVWLTGRYGAGGWKTSPTGKSGPGGNATPCWLIDGNQYFEIGTGFDKVYTGSSTRYNRLYLEINDNTPGNGDGASLSTSRSTGLPDGPTGRQDLPGRFRVSRLRHHQHPLVGLEESNARNSGRLVSWD